MVGEYVFKPKNEEFIIVLGISPRVLKNGLVNTAQFLMGVPIQDYGRCFHNWIDRL